MLRRALFGCAATVAIFGCSANDATAPSEPVGSSSSAITTSDVVSRAAEWVNAKLLYCQSPNHAQDDDTACSPVCNREDNPDWDPYRSDCSGFVSWAWGLPAPGRTTSEFAPADTAVSHAIQGTDLEPGDALNDPADHIILFVQWVTPNQSAEFYEEPGCSANPPYAHAFTSNVTITGESVYVDYEGMTFTAIRYDAIQPPDAGTDASAPDASDAKDAGAAKQDAAPKSDDDASAVEPDAGVASAPRAGAGCSAGGVPRTAGSAEGIVALVLAFVVTRRRRPRTRQAR